MDFLRRLKFYLIGVGLGILLVLAIFKDRKLTSWTPENQILQRMENFDLILTDLSSCQLTCLGIDTAELRSILVSGDVKFGESLVNDTIKSYVIDSEDSRISKAEIQLKNEQAIVRKVIFGSGITCDCKN